jgi:hypothetical protein
MKIITVPLYLESACDISESDFVSHVLLKVIPKYYFTTCENLINVTVGLGVSKDSTEIRILKGDVIIENTKENILKMQKAQSATLHQFYDSLLINAN